MGPSLICSSSSVGPALFIDVLLWWKTLIYIFISIFGMCRWVVRVGGCASCKTFHVKWGSTAASQCPSGRAHTNTFKTCTKTQHNISNFLLFCSWMLTRTDSPTATGSVTTKCWGEASSVRADELAKAGNSPSGHTTIHFFHYGGTVL